MSDDLEYPPVVMTVVPRLWAGQEPPEDALQAVVIDYRDESGEPARLCGWSVPVAEGPHRGAAV